MSTPAILGGNPIRSTPFEPRKTMLEAEKQAVLDVLDSDVLSAFIGGPGRFFYGGDRVREFEQAWAAASGYKHAISVNSWTSGLIIAIGAVGVEPGDEVICSPYSMSASATCAMFYGGIPVFADIDPVTFCLDPRSIAERITERTKAIVAVHLFGHPADMDAILEIARPRGIKVIEDAAQAPGVFYKGKPVGALGDIGGFSLNFHKHIHTGEGGVIVTNDDELAFKCQLIRNHGENMVEVQEPADWNNVIGGNYRLTELQAAIGTAQLKHLDRYLEHRQQLAAHLSQRLANIPGISTQPLAEGNTHAYYVYPIKYDATVTHMPRSLLLKAVLAELPPAIGFEQTPLTEGYVKPLYLQKIYQYKKALGSRGYPFAYNPEVVYDYRKGLCPVVERMYEKELLLSPIVREPLTSKDMDDVADAIEKVIENTAAICAALGKEFAGNQVFTPVDAANLSNVR